jgi:uncharacterized membrane protein
LLIGLLLATFAFCVLALTQINTADEQAPTLTMQFALLLTLTAIVGIVVYLNRITKQQYVGRIAERITEESLELVRQLPYGTKVGMQVGEATAEPDLTALGAPLVIQAGADGWVQQISRRAITDAVPQGSVVRIETRVGAYLVRGEPLATVWPCPAPADAARTAGLVGAAVIIGNARTMQQDIDFGIRQLIDIALRALSPAVNDPTTAIEMILRLASLLRPLVIAPLPAQVVSAPGRRVLLTPYDLDHAEYIGHGFAQLRIYVAPHPQVAVTVIRTLKMLRDAAISAGHADAARACTRELELTLEGCEKAGLLPADLEQIRRTANVTDGAARSSDTPRVQW